ncbi:MAG TPA: methyltransferase domain-containing protein [Casimicrobiaceae bacterium]|nr:methyltransferase domain-containing protein [Casimicrobiaceae bacterium]
MTAPRNALAIERYRRHAAGYDASAQRTEPLRRRTIDKLALQPGDVVLDVGCGTGLSFQAILERIGSRGRLMGIEQSPEMMDVARGRVAAQAWTNVTLIEGPIEDVAIPAEVTALLFNFVHDVLQSPAAMKQIFDAAAPGARVACQGMKFFPWWLAPLNLFVMAKARPYMTTFANLSQPWTAFTPYVRRLQRETTMLGMGYIVWGRTATRLS